MESPRVVLAVTTPAAGRGPVTAGVPWPRGAVTDVSRLALTDASGQTIPLQAKVTDRWADGSARWVLLDWVAAAGAGPYTVELGRSARPSDALAPQAHPFQRVGFTPSIRVVDSAGHVHTPAGVTHATEDAGPVRQVVVSRGSFGGLVEFETRCHTFAGLSAVRVEFTLRNPRRAEHPGGLWDLGDPGSVFLKDVSFTFALPTSPVGRVESSRPDTRFQPATTLTLPPPVSGLEDSTRPTSPEPRLLCSPERGAPAVPHPLPFELFQASSGGDNWNGRNHVTRGGSVTLPFRGYRLNGAAGSRATPVVLLPGLGVTMEHFWENFPKAIEASADGLTLRLFPQQSGEPHELQGGEQKTHTFAVAFGADATAEALEWFRTPPRVTLPPEWVAATGAVPYLTPQAADPHADYLALVGAALDGPDTFAHKREVIDEYGWRHFGDIWGDHEAVYAAGEPMVSHYNNQYDAVFGFGVQLLRSGDSRWAGHMDALAAHVADIDIYHTTRDKAAYNGGLFWHTYHYAPADTATHRSYPKLLRTLGGPAGLDPNDPKAKKSKHVYALGGGPGNEQNYAAGLALHYFLTGSEQSRAAAVGLAQWVIDMDDGAKTVFRWLARGDTGLASQSRGPEYHGPGRGSGNSLAALLVGHTLTGDAKFLAKAEQLIRRVVHPADDVASRNLLDVENRWFYTMFLHSLGKYLDHKAELGQLDAAYAYARAALLHYARWMADHEVPTLSRPEILEYPNETWAAQDVRKFEVLRLAARHAGPDADRFRDRARFFFADSVARLMAFPTRTLCRPVVLLLSLGYTAACAADAAPPPAVTVSDFGRPERFVPQKQTALKRAKMLVAAGAVVGFAAVVALAAWLLS